MTTMPSLKTTAPYEIPYAAGTDTPVDVGTMSKAMADRLHALLEERDAEIQAGGIAKSVYQAAAVTRASTALGSFSTPIAATLPKVKPSQLIEVRLFGTVKESLEMTGTGSSGKLVLKVGSVEAEQNLYLLNESVNLAANTALNFVTPTNGSTILGKRGSAMSRNSLVTAGLALGPAIFIVESEAANLVVELQGAAFSTATLSAEKVWLQARVVG